MDKLKTNRKRPTVPVGDLYFFGSRPKTFRYLDEKTKKAIFLFTPDSGSEKYGSDFVRQEMDYDLIEMNISSIGLKLFVELINANPSDKIITTLLNVNQNKKGG